MKRTDFLKSLIGIPIIGKLLVENKVSGNVLPDPHQIYVLTNTGSPYKTVWADKGIIRKINGEYQKLQQNGEITRWITDPTINTFLKHDTRETNKI